MSPDLTDERVAAVLRAFLLAVLPAGTDVILGQPNRVPMPQGPNYVVMTPSRRALLATTEHDEQPDADTIVVSRATSAAFQLDVYGPLSADNAQVISTLLRDDFGCRQMAGTGVQPLYCDDGSQMPLVNGEAQYEQRWMLTVVLQIRPAVSTAAQFADSVRVTIDKAD